MLACFQKEKFQHKEYKQWLFSIPHCPQSIYPAAWSELCEEHPCELGQRAIVLLRHNSQTFLYSLFFEIRFPDVFLFLFHWDPISRHISILYFYWDPIPRHICILYFSSSSSLFWLQLRSLCQIQSQTIENLSKLANWQNNDFFVKKKNRHLSLSKLYLWKSSQF